MQLLLLPVKGAAKLEQLWARWAKFQRLQFEGAASSGACDMLLLWVQLN
jgi:hypothetical protein